MGKVKQSHLKGEKKRICHKESDTTEQLHFHFSLSCIGEGNGNPLQCSCLQNPRDGEAWWAAIYGVAQSRTRLKRLSSSSSSSRALCGLPRWYSGKVSPANAGDARDMGSISGSGRSPGEGNGNPPTYFPGKFHGQKNLAGYSPWGCRESDMNEYVCACPHTHTHTHTQGPLCSSYLSSSP